jgi:hypothetical protein
MRLPEEFLGDLDEEFAKGTHSRLWYWKEMILMVNHLISRWIVFAGGAGVIAGTAMATLSWAHQPTIFVLLPYGLIVVATAVLLRARSDFPFLARFTILLTAFMVASLTQYFELGFHLNVVRQPVWLQAALFGGTLGIGCVISVCAALVSGRGLNRYLSSIALGVLGGGAMFISMKWTNFIPMALAFALLAVASAFVLRQTRALARVALSLLAWTVAGGLLLLIYLAFARRPGDFARFWDAFWPRALVSTVIGSLFVAAAGKRTRSIISN